MLPLTCTSPASSRHDDESMLYSYTLRPSGVTAQSRRPEIVSRLDVYHARRISGHSLAGIANESRSVAYRVGERGMGSECEK